jgi:hypothetical protein
MGVGSAEARASRDIDTTEECANEGLGNDEERLLVGEEPSRTTNTSSAHQLRYLKFPMFEREFESSRKREFESSRKREFERVRERGERERGERERETEPFQVRSVHYACSLCAAALGRRRF